MLKSTGRIALITALSASLVLAGCSKPAADKDAAATQTTATSATASSAAATSSAVAAGFPVEVENCGITVTMEQAPTRVVTLNQGATELVLALGAADQMVGTAYLDDEIDPAVKAEYDKIPVLAEEYPSHEALLTVKPDFVVASYSSAFKPEVAGPRAELQKLGIESYLDPFACKDKALRAPTTWESIYGEVTDMGQLLGRDDTAMSVVEAMKTKIMKVTDAAAGDGKTVFWYDSGTDEPYVGAGKGGPQLILDAVGAKNIFADLDGSWAAGSWETVLAANPDYIVLADASWDTAEAKKEYLKSNESTKDLDAVKNDRFVVVPFAESTPGVHLADGAVKVSAGLSK